MLVPNKRRHATKMKNKSYTEERNPGICNIIKERFFSIIILRLFQVKKLRSWSAICHIWKLSATSQEKKGRLFLNVVVVDIFLCFGCHLCENYDLWIYGKLRENTHIFSEVLALKVKIDVITIIVFFIKMIFSNKPRKKEQTLS